MPTKTPTTPKTPRKPKAPAKKKEALVKAEHEEVKLEKAAPEQEVAVHAKKHSETHKPTLPEGRYIFATGRRKTSIANVRLFVGKGETLVNKKPLDKYFQYSYYKDEIYKPFSITGLEGHYFFTCHINGGGSHSQAQALQYGISFALGSISPEIRQVLKKNGLLTRDDRKKERKKPGLKRARRSPQWAKR